MITMEGVNEYQNSRIILNAQIYFIKKMLDVTREQQTVIRESLKDPPQNPDSTFTKVV
ncbi:MAG: hypothetical protein GYA61_05075 [Spirochaetales bacterium]|nr:hypothetical protein [Exilispira sp.]NMC67582.1 hypothetical protein [Spirochaetales bacterium]